MSYELFRSQYVNELIQHDCTEKIQDVLLCLDIVANEYEFMHKNTDIIVVGELPEVVKYYLAALSVENKSKATIKGYFYILRKFFETVKIPIDKITSNDIRLFMHYHQKETNSKKNTMEHVRVVINAFFQWLVEEEILDRNPARKIEPLKVPKSLRKGISKLELEYLRQACTDKRQKALVDFMYSTGCRVSECANVQLKDIDWNMRSVQILHGKGDKHRVVYFNPECEVSLKAYLDSKKHPSEYLFSRTRAPYGQITPKSLEDIIDKVCVNASEHLTERVTPHRFRHTNATTLIHNGMPVNEVQKLLGHASLDTTMIYTHLDDSDIKNDYDKYL